MLMEEEAYVAEETERRVNRKGGKQPRLVKGSPNPYRGRGGVDTRNMDWESTKKAVSGFFSEAFR